MAKQILNNGDAASAFRLKLNQNFTDLYDNKAIKSHTSSTDEYGVATPSLFGHVKVSDGNGLSILNGVLTVGVASTSNFGTVQLVNNATTDDSTKASTAAALKSVKDSAVVIYNGTTVPSSSLGKDGDLYCKTA